MNIQYIGADLGRGYCKGYTEFNGKAKECIFKSIAGDGRRIDYTKYENPIHLSINEQEYFAGEVAEKESFNPINNFSDDKTADVAKILLCTLLNEIGQSDKVKLCIGVPNKMFNKSTLMEIEKEYIGKTFTIKDIIKGTTKEFSILDATIFRESDAALLYTVNNHPDRIALTNKRLGMVTVGFRTTEITYFDKGMKFNDKLSRTMEIGNRTVLEIIQKQLESQRVMKTLSTIDDDNDYDDLKKKFYMHLVERINQDIEMSWINYQEMDIFIAGGTSKNFDKIPQKFERVDNPQILTAKGLNYVAETRLK
jgi:hypothetical protein